MLRVFFADLFRRFSMTPEPAGRRGASGPSRGHQHRIWLAVIHPAAETSQKSAGHSADGWAVSRCLISCMARFGTETVSDPLQGSHVEKPTVLQTAPFDPMLRHAWGFRCQDRVHPKANVSWLRSSHLPERPDDRVGVPPVDLLPAAGSRQPG